MPDVVSCAGKAEESILGPFREKLWEPFCGAVRGYALILPGDSVAACVSGGKDSMLMAKMLQMLARSGEIPFSVRFLAMDPGYSPANRRRLEENAERLEIPLEIFETNVFRVAEGQKHSPCYLCAKMRRGHLYANAREAGCGKIALGHHRDDVTQTTVMAMLYGSQLQGMMPKLRSTNFQGMELIRPLYCVRERDIIAWAGYNGLEFLRCACRFTEAAEAEEGGVSVSKRQEVRELLRALEEKRPGVEDSVFSAIHAADFDSFPGWKTGGEKHTMNE